MSRAVVFLTCLIALGILWGTLSPPGPDGPGRLLTDKHLHALAFALLVLPTAVTAPRLALRLSPLALAFGGAIELIQPFFDRGAEWGDLLADGIGVAGGLLLGLALYPLLPGERGRGRP